MPDMTVSAAPLTLSADIVALAGGSFDQQDVIASTTQPMTPEQFGSWVAEQLAAASDTLHNAEADAAADERRGEVYKPVVEINVTLHQDR
jgi:hypothetical protein